MEVEDTKYCSGRSYLGEYHSVYVIKEAHPSFLRLLPTGRNNTFLRYYFDEKS